MIDRKIVLIADAGLAKRINTSPTEFIRGDAFRKLMTGISRYSLFMIPDANKMEWKRHRKLLQPGFGPVHLKASVDISKEVVSVLKDDLHQRLNAGIGSVQLNMHEFFTGLGLDIM